MIVYDIPEKKEPYQPLKAEHNTRTLKDIHAGKYVDFKVSIDNKYKTYVITFDFRYTLQVNKDTDPAQLNASLNNVLKKIVKEVRAKYPDLVRRYIIVGEPSSLLATLKANKRAYYTGQYLILLREPKRLINKMTELNNLPIVQGLAHIIDDNITQFFTDNTDIQIKS